jgi:hypothetical protein
VVQPAENWAAKNLPGPFDGTRERRILLQREMCAGAIIIFHVRQQQVAEAAFAEHDNVVEAFPSDRTDQSFGIPDLPWRPWRRRLIANAHRSNSSDENVAKGCIAIADQIAGKLLPSAGFHELVCNPFRGRMRRYSEP